MKRLVALLCMVVFAAGLVSAAPSQKASTHKNAMAKTAAQKAKSRGDNPNIKNEHEKNDRSAKVTAPQKKGGPKARGSVGSLHIDNHTQWYVRIYIDGDYKGTVGPYGDLYFTADSATYRLFGRAVFEDDDDYTFGPANLRVYGGETSTWTLTP